MNAISRYSYVLKNKNGIRFPDRKLLSRRRRIANDLYKGALLDLEIDLTGPCDEYPSLDMDEQCKYSFHLSAQWARPKIVGSISIWGYSLFLFPRFSKQSEILCTATQVTISRIRAERGVMTSGNIMEN